MRVGVYGAYGYQGRLTVDELVRAGLEPVLMGRSAARLESAAADLGLVDAERRAASLEAPDVLVAALRDLDAVINCAGPFVASGTRLARAAVAAGNHYLDTSGEQSAIKAIFDSLTDEAVQARVTVIPAATDAGVPGDLLAHRIFDELGPLDELITAHSIVGGGFSRGSLRTFTANLETVRSGGLTYTDGGWRPDEPARRRSIRFADAVDEKPVVKFALQEVVTVPRHVDVRHVEGVGEADLAAQLATGLREDFIAALPEGPDEQARAEQRFFITLEAVSRSGARARGEVRGNDTYGATAKISVMLAALVADGGARPGVLAAAEIAEPEKLLDALAGLGIDAQLEL